MWITELLKRMSAGSSCGCHFGSCSCGDKARHFYLSTCSTPFPSPPTPPLALLPASSSARFAAAAAARASCAEILNRTKLGDLLLPFFFFFLLSLSLFLLRAHPCCTFRCAPEHAQALAAYCNCLSSLPLFSASAFFRCSCLDFCCIVLLLATGNLICRLIIYVSPCLSLCLLPSHLLGPLLAPFPYSSLPFFIIVFLSSRSPFVLAAT